MILSGAPNFRGMCNIPVAGGVVRPGTLYRSGAFAELTDGDVDKLRQIGIRTVIDLRRDRERSAEPSRLPQGVRTVSLSIADAVSGGLERAYFADLAESPDLAGAEAVIARLYSLLPEGLHRWIGTAFAALAQDGAAPAVIHCAGGKDRTGLFCALLLHVLGAQREAIVADYLATEGRFTAARWADVRRHISSGSGIADCDDICAVLMSVRPAFLDTSFAVIEREWGGADAYLASAGVTEDIKSRLRAVYTGRDA